jgi:hypothetical protein
MKKIKLLSSLILLTIFCLLTPKAFSQNHEDHEEDKTHDKEHHDVHHQNHLALFIGATSNFDHHSTGFTVGIDYEYRFKAMHNLLGLGLLGEYVAVDAGEIIVGIPVFIHLLENLKFVVAPLAIFAEDHDTHENEMNFGGRIGIGADFHLGKLSLGPNVNLDLSNTTSLNYGLTIGFGF